MKLIIILFLFGVCELGNSYAADSKTAETFQIGANNICPFAKPADSTYDQMMGNLNGALEAFNKSCPGAVQQAPPGMQPGTPIQLITRDAQSTNGASALYATGETPSPTTDIGATCFNYESLLKLEYQNALVKPASVQRFASCDGMTEPELSTCIVNIYTEAKSRMGRNCRRTAELKTRAELMNSMLDASNAISRALSNSAVCQKGASQVAEETVQVAAGNFLGALTSAAPAFGMGGLALSMGANIVEGLISKIASDKSATGLIAKIQSEKDFPNIACLWWSMQERVLDCDSNTPRKAEGYIPPFCQGYLSAQPFEKTSITSLVNYFSDSKSILNQRPADEVADKSQETDRKIIDSFDSMLNKKIADPVAGRGEPISMVSHLSEMLKTLKLKENTKNFDRDEMKSISEQVKGLESLIALRGQMYACNPLGEECGFEMIEKDDAGTDLKTKFTAQIKKLDIGVVVDSYWKIKKPNDKIKITEILDLQNFNSSRISKYNQTSLITPVNAMVSTFKATFESALADASQRYSANVEKIKNNKTKDYSISLTDMQMAAGNLTKMCSLIGGLYNSKVEAGLSALTNVQPNNNSKYSEACKKVKCIKSESNDSIIIDPDMKDKSSFDYKKYQCNNRADFNGIMKDLSSKLADVKNHLDNPELCPQ